MKIILQRVTRASVVIKEERIAAISKGLLVLFGVEKHDDEEKAIFLADKTLNLRVFLMERER